MANNNINRATRANRTTTAAQPKKQPAASSAQTISQNAASQIVNSQINRANRPDYARAQPVNRARALAYDTIVNSGRRADPSVTGVRTNPYTGLKTTDERDDLVEQNRKLWMQIPGSTMWDGSFDTVNQYNANRDRINEIDRELGNEEALQPSRDYEGKNAAQRALDVAGTTTKGIGKGIMSGMAGAEAAIAGEGTILNDLYALARSVTDRNDGVSAWEAVKSFDQLGGQRIANSLVGIPEELWNEIGYIGSKLGANIDTENDIFSRAKDKREAALQAAEENYYGKVGDVQNIYTAGQKYRQEQLNAANEEAMLKYQGSPFAQSVYKYGTMAGQQLPTVALSIAMAYAGNVAGGASIAGGLAPATTEGLQWISAFNNSSKLQQLGMLAGNSVGQIASNPQYWSSVAMETGSAYNEAIEKGVDPSQASAYAICYALLSSIIEVGGSDEAANTMENLPKKVREAIQSGNIDQAAWDYAKSVIGEIGEEEWQGMLQKTLNGSMLGEEIPIFSMDNPDAIINPASMLETAKDTAITTMILNSGQTAVTGGIQSRLNKHYNNQMQNELATQIEAELRGKWGTEEPTQKTIKEYAKLAAKQAMGQKLTPAEQTKLDSKPSVKEAVDTVASKKVTDTMVENAFKDSGLNAAQINVLKDGVELSGKLDPAEAIAETKTAFEQGKTGKLTVEEVMQQSKLDPTVAKHAYQLGAGQQISAEVADIATEEGKNAVESRLSPLGAQAATAAEVYEPGQDVSTFAAGMLKATQLYAANGANLAEVYEAAKKGDVNDPILAKLTPAQIEKAQEIGNALRAEQVEAAQKSAAELAAVQNNAQELLDAQNPELVSINEAIAEAQNYISDVQGKIDSATAALDAMQQADPDVVNTEEYQNMLQTIATQKSDIEATQDILNQLKQAQATAREQSQGKRKMGTVTTRDVTLDNGTVLKAADLSNLTRNQQHIVAMVNATADALPIDFVLYNDANSTAGVYVKGGTVYLNIGATVQNRQGIAQSLAGVALSHELTHYIQDFAPEEYNALRDFVSSELLNTNAEEFRALVQQQIKIADKNGQHMSYDEAVNEVVANACQKMLYDSKAITKLARENMNIAERILDIIEEIIGKIQAAFEGIDINDENVDLYRAARAMLNRFEEMQKLWDAGIEAAAKNNVASKATNKTAAEGNEVQYLIWDEDNRTHSGNTPITEEDVPEYLKTGVREHVRSAKGKIIDEGGSPILKTREEVASFIGDAIDGKITNTIKAYGKVGDAYADDLYYATNGLLDAHGAWLEIDANRMAHAGDHSEFDNDPRNIPLTREQMEHINEYMDDYDDILQVLMRKDGSVRIFTSKAVPGGNVVIVELASVGRGSLQPVTGWQNSEQAFKAIWGNKKRVLSTSLSTKKVKLSGYTGTLENKIPENAAPVKQNYSSAATSINANKLPVLYTNKNAEFEPGGTNIDIGGGRFDNVTEYLKTEHGVQNYIFDPFNRSEEHNSNVLKFLTDGNKADTATCSNCLNVIDTEAARANVILEMAKSIKPDGKAYFTVYEGNGSGVGQQTKAGWQENRKTADYVPEIEQYFDTVTRKGNLIIAEDPKANLPKAAWEVTPGKAMQFMMNTDTEETDRLMAIHNKSVSGLQRMLARNGVPFPSIAIKKAGSPHTGFGDVSIVFPRSTIDPEVNRQNRIYSNDAWTPTEPATEYDVGDTYRYMKKLRKQIGDEMYNTLRGGSYLEESELSKRLLYSNGNIAEALKNISILKYAYLKSIGKEPAAPIKEQTLDGFGKYKNEQLLAIFDALSESEIENMKYGDETAQKVADILNEQFRNQYEDGTKEFKALFSKPLYDVKDINPGAIKDAYNRYIDNGKKIQNEIDYYALDRTLRGDMDTENSDEYHKWIEEEFKDLIVDSGIRNDKDLFTPSGNRRSFKQLHRPATLDNIVEEMRKKEETGIGVMGINLRGAATKSYRTVEDARAESSRLMGEHIADSLFDKPMEEFNQRLNDMANAVSGIDPNDIRSWSHADAVRETLLEAIRDCNSVTQMRNKLKKEERWFPGISNYAADLWQLKQDVQNMQAPYFEAKPRRVVYPQEALAYVVPDNADPAVVKALEDRGLNVLTYKAGDEADRLAKVNSVENAQFMRWDDTANDTEQQSLDREMSYARLEAEKAIQDEMLQSLQKLTAKQENTIAKLQQRLHLTKDPEVRENDAKKLAKSLLQANDSKADATEIATDLKEIGDYILNGQVNPDELRSKAWNVASKIINAAEVTQVQDNDTITEIRNRINGTKFKISPDETGDIEGYENLNDFRKKNFGRFSIVTNDSKSVTPEHQAVDSFYQELRDTYGDYYFPELTNQGEMMKVIADFYDAGEGLTVNPFEQYMGEATEALTNDIIKDALDGIMRPATTDADRWKSRREFLNAQIKDLKKQGALQDKEAARLWATVADLSLQLDKADSKYKTLQAEANYRAEQLKIEGRQRAVEIRAAEREKAAEQVQALKDYYARMAQKRANTGTRRQIRKMVDDLNARLARPSENKHVPRELVQQTVDVLRMIDYDSGRGGEKFAERIAKIRNMYDSYQNNETYAVAYDEVTAEMLKNLAVAVDGKSLYQMDEQQLDTVYTTLKSMIHVIDNAVKVRIGNEERNAFDVSREMTQETRAIGKEQKGWLRQHFLPAHLRADVAFNRFGGFKKNSAWQAAARMLNDGQLKQTDVHMKLSQPFSELINDDKALREFNGLNAFGHLDDSKLVDIGLKDENGEAIPVTHDIMVGIYMDLMNEDNRRHFIRSGKTIPNLKDFYTGKGGFGFGSKRAVGISTELSDLNHQLTEANQAGNQELADELKDRIEEIKVTGENYADSVKKNIEANLTAYDRKWIQQAKQLMDVDSKNYLNQTTMDVYGIEKANVENYWPITSDPNFLSTPFESITKDASLENVGFMKERVKSGKPTLALGTSQVVNNQINRVAQYSGLMPAIRNFNKIWNKVGYGYSDSLKNSLNATFGKDGTKYVENLLADLTGSRDRGDDTLGVSSLMARLRGNLAQTTLTLNPRVALSQAASFPTAAAELGAKPLAKALAKGGKDGRMISRADQELIEKYSPLLYHRMQGYSSVELGDIKNSQRLSSRVWKKMRWATGWIQAVDGATVGRLWDASKYWVDDHMTNLEKGTDAYYQEVAKKFNDVVEKTQPNYTTMQRAAILRDPNELVKSLTMFMTQRLQNFNILYDAAGSYQKARSDFANGRNGVTRADVAEAKAQLARSVGSQVAQAAVFVGFKLLADALMHNMKAYRDDEEGELTAESVSMQLLDNYIDAVTGTMIGGSELTSIIRAATGGSKWYGLSLSGVDSVNDLVDNIMTLATTKYDRSTDKGKAAFDKQLMKVGQSLAQYLGIPASNAIKIKDAIAGHIEDIASGEFGSFNAGFEKTNAQNITTMVNALKSGDTTAIEDAATAWEDRDKMRSAVKSALKEQYMNGEIGAQEAVRLLKLNGERDKALKNLDKKWAFEKQHGFSYDNLREKYLDGGIQRADVISALVKVGGKTAKDAQEIVSDYDFAKKHEGEYGEYGLSVSQAKPWYNKYKSQVTLEQYADQIDEYGTTAVKDYYDEWKPKTGMTIQQYSSYKSTAPLYGDEKKISAYNTWKSELRSTMSLQRFLTILKAADTDGNDSLKQDELGYRLVQAVNNNEMSYEQASAIWDSMGWKSGFDKWVKKRKK